MEQTTQKRHFMSLKLNKYHCNICNWNGSEEELEWDEVDTCMGADKIEMCPLCGSLDVTKSKNENKVTEDI